MPPHLTWSRGAIARFMWLPNHDAERVDAAVLRFAERGEGQLDNVRGDPYGFRLRVPGYAVRLEIKDEMIRVLDIFRVR
jgi:hypothetical protein